MEIMSLPFLQTIGLSPVEGDLYQLLLQLGQAPVAKIVAKSGLKRPTAYKALYVLEQKGLATKKDINKKIHFAPTPPTTILQLINQQSSSIDQAKNDFQTLLPQLSSQYILAVEKPIVTTFEGVEGLKKMYDDQVAEGKPIYAFQNTEVVEPQLFKWLTTTHVKQRVRAKIPAWVIVSSVDWAKEYAKRDDKELRTTQIVPADKFPFQHGVDIYGDKVAFINYKKDEALIGIIVKHPSIARTMKAIFDLAWKGASQKD